MHVEPQSARVSTPDRQYARNDRITSLRHVPSNASARAKALDIISKVLFSNLNCLEA